MNIFKVLIELVDIYLVTNSNCTVRHKLMDSPVEEVDLPGFP